MFHLSRAITLSHKPGTVNKVAWMCYIRLGRAWCSSFFCPNVFHPFDFSNTRSPRMEQEQLISLLSWGDRFWAKNAAGLDTWTNKVQPLKSLFYRLLKEGKASDFLSLWRTLVGHKNGQMLYPWLDGLLEYAAEASTDAAPDSVYRELIPFASPQSLQWAMRCDQALEKYLYDQVSQDPNKRSSSTALKSRGCGIQRDIFLAHIPSQAPSETTIARSCKK